MFSVFTHAMKPVTQTVSLGYLCLEFISPPLCNCCVRECDDFLLCFVTRSCWMLNSHG